METVITILSVILGSGIFSALFTYLSSRKINEATAHKTDIEASNLRIDYVQNEMKELYEKAKAEADSAKATNTELQTQIETLLSENRKLQTEVNQLNLTLNSLMTWVVDDNARYRAWLELRLKELKPDITFPTCSTCPVPTYTAPHTTEEKVEEVEEQK